MSVGGFDIGSAVGSFADFATDFAADFTSDFGLDSFTDSFGTEFLTDIGGSFVDFGGDIFSGAGEFLGDIGGSLYEQVGSFAGDANWFNATSFGSILDSAGTGISEFFGDIGGSLSGITNYLPTSVSSITGALPSGLTSIPGVGSIVNGATNIGTNLLTTATRAIVPTGAALLSNATGLDPRLINTALSGQLPGIGSLTGIPAGVNPSVVPGFGGGGISLSSILTGPGFGAPVGYGTPRSASVGGFNVGGALNSAVAFVTGSGSAQAQPRPTNTTLQFPDSAYGSTGILDIEITGVGVNLSDTVAQDPTRATTTGGNFTEFYNSETGLYDVFNNDTGETVQSGLNQQAAILAAQDLSIGNAGQDLSERAVNVNPANFPAYDDEGNLLPGYALDENEEPYFAGFGTVRTSAADVNLANFPAYDDDGNLLPGYELDEDNNPVFVGSSASNLSGLLNNAAGATRGLLDQARQQQTIRDQRQNRAQSSDWRVRLRLAPRSTYLYNAPDVGPVLQPLRNTDGVIFPYTPSIDTAYKADYDAYNLTHSNYRGYFYKGSYVDSINVRAMFTAQDTAEANYLLAVIHFFRSATKMFYGQDAQRGSPPPLVYLSGLGEFQFNEHPCVISQFNYNLPGDVDYIRAHSAGINGTNLQVNRNRQTIAGNPLSYSINRLASVFLTKGALDTRLSSGSLAIEEPTYVPTKMEISLTLFPMQSRSQVSKEFSVKNFANGNLLKGGFW
ncbi:hypothetical protein UFOVP328_232 [uncultured Caudovirales phage]|uniref:Uncharacterized protein n=1 Tax=uncultured Caudovirales phage TaxID=2100421 RepID=A0A6J5M1Z2_9CAUD|nr:hypothetical protein UFOVP328_232 [uncultured Caudovirales phage]